MSSDGLPRRVHPFAGDAGVGHGYGDPLLARLVGGRGSLAVAPPVIAVLGDLRLHDPPLVEPPDPVALAGIQAEGIIALAYALEQERDPEDPGGTDSLRIPHPEEIVADYEELTPDQRMRPLRCRAGSKTDH